MGRKSGCYKGEILAREWKWMILEQNSKQRQAGKDAKDHVEVVERGERKREKRW